MQAETNNNKTTKKSLGKSQQNEMGLEETIKKRFNSLFHDDIKQYLLQNIEKFLQEIEGKRYTKELALKHKKFLQPKSIFNYIRENLKESTPQVKKDIIQLLEKGFQSIKTQKSQIFQFSKISNEIVSEINVKKLKKKFDNLKNQHILPKLKLEIPFVTDFLKKNGYFFNTRYNKRKIATEKISKKEEPKAVESSQIKEEESSEAKESEAASQKIEEERNDEDKQSEGQGSKKTLCTTLIEEEQHTQLKEKCPKVKKAKVLQPEKSPKQKKRKTLKKPKRTLRKRRASKKLSQKTEAKKKYSELKTTKRRKTSSLKVTNLLKPKRFEPAEVVKSKAKKLYQQENTERIETFFNQFQNEQDELHSEALFKLNGADQKNDFTGYEGFNKDLVYEEKTQVQASKNLSYIYDKCYQFITNFNSNNQVPMRQTGIPKPRKARSFDERLMRCYQGAPVKQEVIKAKSYHERIFNNVELALLLPIKEEPLETQSQDERMYSNVELGSPDRNHEPLNKFHSDYLSIEDSFTRLTGQSTQEIQPEEPQQVSEPSQDYPTQAYQTSQLDFLTIDETESIKPRDELREFLSSDNQY